MNKKIKIIHICDKFGRKGSTIHGVSRLFQWWMPLFNSNLFDVKLVGLRKQDKACENLIDQGINIKSLARGKFDLFTLKDIVNIIKQENADIVHLHGYGASNFGIAAARITGIKCVVHEHFVDPAYPGYQLPFDYFLAPRADMGIAICESVKEFMVNKRYFRRNNVKVVFNGIPINNFTHKEKSLVLEEKKRLGLPDDHKIIASIGRLDEQKGNCYFIAAAAKLLKKNNKLKFLLVGDGPLMNDLKEQTRKLNIQDYVIFTGHYQDIPLLQSMIDIQVFPSIWEGTTLTIFEAFAMSLPVVSTNADGLGEVVKNEINGLSVVPKDSQLFADAIEELINNPEKAERLAKNGNEEIKKYDISLCVKNIENIYIELMS